MDFQYSDDPKMEYLLLLVNGQLEKAVELKLNIVPKSLFRFQPPKYNRFRTIQNKQLFLNSASNFDDPFDSIGNYYDFQRLADNQKTSIDNITQKINQLNKERQKSLSVCFCENINNLPLWAFYTQNYQGFAIEYNFFEVPNNAFIERLFPILYGPKKPNITNLLLEFENRIINKKDVSDIELKLLSVALLKHESWKFQNEWRIIGEEHILSNICPEAIYIGYKSTKFTQSKLLNISKKIGCKCYLMKCADIEQNEFALKFDEIT